MDLKGKKVLVVGLGKSGYAAYELLKEMGADISLYDGNESLEVKVDDVDVYLGDFDRNIFKKFEIAVFSPGVPLDIPIADFLRENGTEIIGEIELAYLWEKGTVVAITGTNGKTTTTTLVGEICKAYNPKTYVVGNIGNPYTKEVLKTSEDSITVAEISSFQLETMKTFKPKVSAILNITPDHLNRHKTMENYIAAKLSVASNQGPKDLCVINYEDELLRKNLSKIITKIQFFSSSRVIEKGMYKDEEGFIVDGITKKRLLDQRDTKLPGDHNAENIMAALLIVKKLGVPMDLAVEVVKNFSPVEHRVEFVETVDGVDYYNDSKGTNPDAAIKGIQSMDRPTVLIGGGYDKGGEFDAWIESFDGKVKKLLLMGETRERIAETAKKLGFTDYEFVDSLEDAVARAEEIAVSGDAVLLSPACASWDMFDSYEQRGNIFKELVRKQR
ncbi:UDP-N-acetylmuramoyl-L-alanine--D-glutamate ligase [Eubacterium xylanophilum]|uniref:UDP-N-acetylmuramoyl-L-alanine--D-glutamate ligase n=1 Tax=Eubacterium xylanophilum TaxID=39497 RepID=UPI00047C2193|nr:UDP-N-acetylmuramoyl-L-alanine--D-glutamate ligase [Eubacterium xylanophilum]